MTNNTRTPSGLLTVLTEAGLIRDQEHSHPLPPPDPWFVKAMQAFSGWIASLFLLLALWGMFHSLFRSSFALLLVGTGLIAVAYLFLKNRTEKLFLEHVALSLSLAGQALVTIAFWQWVTPHTLSQSLPWIALAGLELVLLISMPDYVHRVFSAMVFALASVQASWLLGGRSIVIPLILWATVWLWQSEYRHPKYLSLKQAAGYGMSLALLWVAGAGFSTISGYMFSSDLHALMPLNVPWIVALLNGGVMLYALYSMLHSLPSQPKSMVWVGGVILIVLIAVLSTKMTGLSIAVTLLIVGFARGNILLQGMSIASLLWCTGRFYYTLQATLLIKSLLLVGTGIIFLGIYIIFFHTDVSEEKGGDGHEK